MGMARSVAPRSSARRSALPRVRRRAEARHGDGNDAGAIQSQRVEGVGNDQQRQRGVQPARHTDGHRCAPMWRSRFASPVD